VVKATASKSVVVSPHGRVLLVQPERDDREMYCEYLSAHGLVPMPVSNGSDALVLAPKADIVVTGILLPGPIDGIELIRRLRVDDVTREMPVIVLTSCAWNSERERAVQGGCDAFLAKPCLPEDLVREVQRLLTAARLDPRRAPAKAHLPVHDVARRPKRTG
jgi:two-component system, cell cycle response regulator DivK